MTKETALWFSNEVFERRCEAKYYYSFVHVQVVLHVKTHVLDDNKYYYRWFLVSITSYCFLFNIKITSPRACRWFVHISKQKITKIFAFKDWVKEQRACDCVTSAKQTQGSQADFKYNTRWVLQNVCRKDEAIFIVKRTGKLL